MKKFSIALVCLVIVVAGCCVGFSKSKTMPTLLVGSVNSEIYHYSDCPSAKAISSKNLIVFADEDTARIMGKRLCDKCFLRKNKQRRR